MFHLTDPATGRTLRTYPTWAAADQARRALARMSNVDGIVRTDRHVAECYWADYPGETCDDDRCLRHGIDCTRPGCEVPVEGDTSEDVEGGGREATSTAEAVAQFEAQGRIAPGTPGWWKVWGASVQDVRAGDLVATLPDPAGPLVWSLVHELFTARAHPLRYGLVTDGGERFTLGALVPVVVLRRGTHHVLSGSAR